MTEEYPAVDRTRLTRVRPRERAFPFSCLCGREFASAQGRGNHRRACQIAVAVYEWEAAQMQAGIDRALARLVDDPNLRNLSRRRRSAYVPPTTPESAGQATERETRP